MNRTCGEQSERCERSRSGSEGDEIQPSLPFFHLTKTPPPRTQTHLLTTTNKDDPLHLQMTLHKPPERIQLAVERDGRIILFQTRRHDRRVRVRVPIGIGIGIRRIEVIGPRMEVLIHIDRDGRIQR